MLIVSTIISMQESTPLLKYSTIACTLLFALMLYAPVASAARLQVAITGVSGDELGNIKSSLSIVQLISGSSLLEVLTSTKGVEISPQEEENLKRLHKAAPQEINSALQPFGYYHSTVESSLAREGDLWVVQYTVTLNRAILIDSVSVKLTGAGEAEPELRRILAVSLVRKGKRLNHQNYNLTKSALLQKSADLGYLDAGYTQARLAVDPSLHTANVTLLLDTGEKFVFGEVDIVQSALSDDAISRYLPFSPGDDFDVNKLIELELALSDSKYFERVDVEPNRQEASGNRIPVRVTAVAKRPREYTLGVGYGTNTGPRLKFGADFRRINKRGHRVSSDILFSGIKNSAAIQYEIPLGGGGKRNLRFLARIDEEEVGDDGKRNAFVTGVTYNDSWRGWQRRVYADYTSENFEFGQKDQTVAHLIPGISFTYTKADDLLLSHRGRSWFFDIHGSSNAVLSSSSFLQARLVGQQVWSPSETTRILSRFEAGTTLVDDFTNLPASQRFFSGGDQSVRGYAFRALGSLDTDDNIIGGRHLAAASLEFDYLFYKNFGGALFIDVGGATVDAPFDWSTGVGAGFRWKTPVGMFRFDAAVPLDDSSTDFRLHISIGADL